MFKMENVDLPFVSEIAKNFFLLDFHHRCLSVDAKNQTKPENVQVTSGDKNLPLVFLIGGLGGSGKSSFIQFCKDHMANVYEESTVDPCKQVAAFMMELETKKYHKHNVGTLVSDIDLKNDVYRSLLHDIKVAWCKADDGPNEITISIVRNLLESTESPMAIFINVREPEQIVHLRKKLQDMLSAIVITVAILRDTISSEDFSNEGDRTTLDFKYDLCIDNDGDISELEVTAEQFCLAVDATNRQVSYMCNCLN